MNTNKKQPVYYINGSPVYASEFEENKFPLTVFPKVIADLIQELKEYYGYPVEFSSGSLLIAFATAIGSNTQLKFKDDFIVMANLYLTLCGAPGTCKSHPITYFLKPIREKQALFYTEHKRKMKEYDNYESMSKKEKEAQLPVEKPIKREITLDNYTLETLLLKLSENPKGLSVIVDELNGFFENMNRYSGGSDSETYNSLWTGAPINVSRKTTDSYFIPPTAVSVFGTIQPAIIDNIFSKGKDKNGLAARFLFIMPEGLLPIKWTINEVNHDLYEKYNHAIQKLLDVESCIDEEGMLIPTFLRFTKEASVRIIEWQTGEDEYYGESIIEMGNTHYEAFRKFDTYVLRFALILQMIYSSVEEDESPTEVGIRAVENAVLLFSYFKKEVFKIHRLLYEKDIRLQMSETQQKVYDMLPPEFYIGQKYDEVAKLGFTKDQLKKFVGIKKYFTRINRGCYKKNFIELSDE